MVLTEKPIIKEQFDEFGKYKDQIQDDIINYIIDNKIEFDEPSELEELYDEMFVSDAITGNASGSYFCSSYEAVLMIGDIIYSKSLLDIYRDFGYDHVKLEDGPESIDVTIRCGLLSECLQRVIESIEEMLNE